MTLAMSWTLRPALPLALAAIATPGADAQRVDYAQTTIRQRVIIRVPRMGPPPLPVGRRPISATTEWKEGKGPACVSADTMAGALISGTDTIDLVLRGGARVRVQLDGACPPLGFYTGFYLRGSPDGMVCAGRDPIRVRSGASCPIKRFRTLTPKR
jgi:hypothetical protein